MEGTETKMDRELLKALRRRAAEEGREEYEVLEDAVASTCSTATGPALPN
jgi:hypothetical protein